MDFVKVAKVRDFTNKSIISFSILGKKVGLLKREDGSFHALEIGCKHQGADLTKGERNGMVATCPRHQWQYDLETGKCLTNSSPDLRKYAVRRDGENILVSLLPFDYSESSG